jgi:hypothetical protein
MVKAKAKQKHAISLHLQKNIYNHIKQLDSNENNLYFEQENQLL